MEQQLTSNGLKSLFDSKKNEVISLCKQVAENEFNLFEFNLFLASIGKKKLDQSTRKVRELRKKIDNGDVDLSKYEDMLEDF